MIFLVLGIKESLVWRFSLSLPESMLFMAVGLRLPFGSELSPDVIGLSFLLEVCNDYSGDKEAIETHIRQKYFYNSGGITSNQSKLAMNCRLSLQKYKLLDSCFILTDVGKKLYKLRDDEKIFLQYFAKHILLELNGLAFVQCLKEMFIAGENINLTTLRKALSLRNIYYPSGGKHPSIMRLWLEKAGVLSGWRVNNETLNKVLGHSDISDGLSDLNELQKAFLKAMVSLDISEPQSASDVVKLATATYGLEFPEKSLPKLVLNKLVEKGFIVSIKTTNGRGAKPFKVNLAPNINPSIILPALKQQENQISPKLHSLIIKPLSEIVEEIESKPVG